MNDSYRPGDTVYSYFGYQNPNGAGTPATSIAASVRRNENADITGTPTFTNLGSGLYRNVFTIPAIFQVGDQVTIIATPTLTGTPNAPTPIWEGRLVSWPTDALPVGGFGTGSGIPNARQIREEMDARSTHLASMDNRLPGTPAQYGQIGTPGRGTVAAELSQTGAVVEGIYNKVADRADVPTLAQMVAALQNDRVTGTTTGTPTTTSVPCSGSDLSSSDDAYNGAFLLLTSGALKGVAQKITDYTGSSKTFTTQAFPAAPAAGVSVAVIGRVPS